MGFKKNGPGCCPCGGTGCGTINRTIKGCNGLALPGATVDLRDAGLTVLDTQTSDGSGNVSFTGLVAGTYSLAVSKAPRFASGTVSGLVIDCVTSPTLSGTTTMSPSSSYVCRSGCADPIKKTLVWTTSSGTGTATYGTPIAGSWFGTATWATTHVCTGSGPAPYSVALVDNGAGGFTITVAANEYCVGPTGLNWSWESGLCVGGTEIPNSASATSTPGCTLPFSASASPAWGPSGGTCFSATEPTDYPTTGAVTWSE